MRRLAALLPDVPRFVEVRDVLLGGDAEVFGFEEGGEGPSFVARDREDATVYVVGRPRPPALLEAVARDRADGDVIALPENVQVVAEALPERDPQAATLHLLDGGGVRSSDTAQDGVRLLSGLGEPPAIGPDLPPDLRAELSRALGRGVPIAAAFVEDSPVSFCYAAAETEGLWDVSVDTRDGHRRRGHAARCALFMVRRMRETAGKEPVWAALETNVASMNLAASLGFVPVDRYFVLEPAAGRG